jgi:hypothetical protein
VHKDDLRDARNDYEDAALRRLAEVLPNGVTATILADRGFADTKLFEFLTELGFGYVIRLKGNTRLSAADGTTRPAAEGQGGRARKLRDAAVTEARRPIGAAVCVHARDMKEPWCLVTSNRDATAPQIIKLYSKRWGVEPGFRDTKDLRFGRGAVRIADPQRRCCCSTPSPSSCSPCSVPLARASAWIATSSPTPSRPAPIPCSARAPRSTT